MATWTNRRAQITGRIAAAALCAAATGYLAVGTAGASNAPAKSSPVNIFKISGAGSGTLHPGPYSGCNNIDVKSDGFTNFNDLVGPISGFTKNVASWTLDVTENKAGTFKITGSYAKDPTVSLIPITTPATTAIKWTFFAKSGTLTIAAESGSISASMSDRSGQRLKISGGWNCKTF